MLISIEAECCNRKPKGVNNACSNNDETTMRYNLFESEVCLSSVHIAVIQWFSGIILVEKDQEQTRELSFRKEVQETSRVYFVCGEIQTEIMLLTRRIKKKGPIGKREGSEWEIFGHMLWLEKGWKTTPTAKLVTLQ